MLRCARINISGRDLCSWFMVESFNESLHLTQIHIQHKTYVSPKINFEAISFGNVSLLKENYKCLYSNRNTFHLICKTNLQKYKTWKIHNVWINRLR